MVTWKKHPEIPSILSGISSGSPSEICSWITLGTPLKIPAWMSPRFFTAVHQENPAENPPEILAKVHTEISLGFSLNILPSISIEIWHFSKKNNSNCSTTSTLWNLFETKVRTVSTEFFQEIRLRTPGEIPGQKLLKQFLMLPLELPEGMPRIKRWVIPEETPWDTTKNRKKSEGICTQKHLNYYLEEFLNEVLQKQKKLEEFYSHPRHPRNTGNIIKICFKGIPGKTICKYWLDLNLKETLEQRWAHFR